MTNDKTVTISRELAEDIAQALSDDPARHDDPMTSEYALKLRALLGASVVERQYDDLSSELKALAVIGEYPSTDDADAHDEWLDNNASTAIWLLGNLDRICCALNSFPAPAVELDLVYNKMTDGLHIRRWENFGGLREGVHRLYTSPPAPVAVPDAVRNRLNEVWLFLDGQAELNSCTFGEKPEGRHQFWWRKELRTAIEDLDACLDKVKEMNQ